MRNFIHTSESVTAGHPDKLCDLISDSIVDAFLGGETGRPVNAECALASGIAFLAVRCHGGVEADLAAIVRRAVREAGYAAPGFDAESCTVMSNVSEDPELAHIGPGRPLHVRHSATLFGHACRQTPEMMPLPIVAAHRLTRALDAARAGGGPGFLTPDGQSQVAIEYRDRKPVRIHNVGLTVAVDTGAGADTADVERWFRDTLVPEALAGLAIGPDRETRVVVRQVAAPADGIPGHAGLTGRKSAADLYGGFARQGTAALSGKDPARIDRAAVYAARHMAMCIVAAGLAEECEVQLSYCAGQDEPVSLEVDSFGSARRPDESLSELMRGAFDLTLSAIAGRYRLWDLPADRDGRFYASLATRGQVGRPDLDLPWEDTDAAAALAG